MIEEINTAYSGILNEPIKKSLDSGKKIKRVEKSLFEKMLEEEKIDVPRIDNSQRTKKIEYPEPAKGNYIDIVI
ncbi:hypothetical protein M0R19_06670 [Candidatus Pacearchaeota archaeon]|jgi:hypothetical protein|nr:hypothetical protein [Candidatus Pacearchaeota archaeon]